MSKTEEGTGPQSKEEIRKRLGELLEPQIVDILTNQITIKSIKKDKKLICMSSETMFFLKRKKLLFKSFLILAKFAEK